jgi:hypothetical protein
MSAQQRLALIGGDVARPEKPILCLDFDGVLHSYRSGWQGIDQIPDPPVPGFAEFLAAAVEHFHVVVWSSRSAELDGIVAMKNWLIKALHDHGCTPLTAANLLERIGWPTSKPPAFVTLDDRALTFSGEWPAIALLRDFKPWYQRGGGDG